MNQRSTLSKCVSLLHTRKFEFLWHRLAEYIQAYFRIEVEGVENIPRNGPAVIISNHSGYSGFDAIMIAHLIHTQVGRKPKILAHRAYFDWSHFIRLVALSFGLRKACLANGVQILKDGQLLILFPEGESGNFKSSTRKYQLQKFHSGFLRMADATRAPIIPCVVIGAEESFLNFGNIDLSRHVKGLKIPLPVNWFPFPAKWKIRFLKPVELKAAPKAPPLDYRQVDQTCHRIRHLLQSNINHELEKRSYIYYPH